MAKNKRPLTQQELANAKAEKTKDRVVITNTTGRSGVAKQSIPLQISEPGVDFYVGERTDHLGVNKRMEVTLNSVNMEQLQVLSKRRMLNYKIVRG